jgi:hypothetical protein
MLTSNNMTDSPKTKLAPRLLVHSSSTSIIQAPLEQVNISEWLFTLSDEEYQQCSLAHIACGPSRAADGKRMSLNVEEIGGSLTVQHYVENIAEKQHCRVISTSDVFANGNRTTAHVVWELIAKRLSDITCELTNVMLVHTTDDYEHFLETSGLTFEQAKAALASAVEAHNAEETPLFAKSIGKLAQSGRDSVLAFNHESYLWDDSFF